MAIIVYEIYRDSRDWGFKDQICRAVVSISNNVAEGFDRESDADFVRFLNYARTSSNEVKSMSYLACRLYCIDETQKDHFIKATEELSKMIYAFTKTLNK